MCQQYGIETLREKFRRQWPFEHGIANDELRVRPQNGEALPHERTLTPVLVDQKDPGGHRDAASPADIFSPMTRSPTLVPVGPV